jgi:glutamate--cysteine ligase catalytic subunit
LSSVEVDADTHCTIHQYLRLIQKRASGELMTAAHWIRKFVTEHPDYKYKMELFTIFFYKLISILLFMLSSFRRDSVVSETINYDLLTTMERIQNGSLDCPALLLDHSRSKTRDFIPAPIMKAENCHDC